MGTPAYMAPEQIAGLKASARADQFAFCVALWEAIEGTRPFAGGSLVALAEEVRAGRLQAPPKRLPRRIRTALLRGLRVNPEDRFPSMRELGRALRPVSRWWLGIGAAAAGAALTTATVMWTSGSRGLAPSEPCPNPNEEWHGVWEQPRREELRRALAAARVQEPVIQRTLSNLDAYARAWKRASRESCEATRVQHAQTEDVHELRTRCLGRHRESFQELVSALTRSAGTASDHAVLATLQLPPVASCNDGSTLLAAAVPPPPTELAPRVEELRKRLITARASKLVGRVQAAWTDAREIAEESRTLGYRPLLADALLLQAETSFEDERKKLFLEATWVAEAGRNDEAAARGWVALVDLATEEKNAASAEEWWQRATCSIERLRGAPELKSQLLSSLARGKESSGDAARARTMALEALRERRSPEGDESLADMTDLRTLVRTGFQLDELGEAEKSLRKLQQVGRRLVGADDEETALYAARLAAERGAWEESISLHDEAWSRAEASLARALRAAQPPAEEDARDFHALERILITVAPVRRARGMQAAIVTSRGDVAAARGNWPAAEQEYDRALKLVEVGLGPKSSLVVSPLTGLSHTARLTGGLERARSLAQRAVDIAGGVPACAPPAIRPSPRPSLPTRSPATARLQRSNRRNRPCRATELSAIRAVRSSHAFVRRCPGDGRRLSRHPRARWAGVRGGRGARVA